MKSAVEALLIHSGVVRGLRFFTRHHVVVLAYHNVVRDGDAGLGDASLHIPASRFREHLDMLARSCDFVPLTDVLVPNARAARPDRLRIALTFDDAYDGTITLGLPELERRGIPGTVFVTPGFLGGKTFWWDDFRFVVGSAERDHALASLAGDDERVRAWAKGRGIAPRPTPSSFRVAAEEQVRAATASGKITLGAHGWRHRNFTALSDADLREELERPAQWLTEHCSGVIPWVAYPYGLSDARVERAAAAAGYAGGLRTVGGGAPVPPADPWRTPRLTVPAGLSVNGLSLRTGGGA
jgi:peptidoglycan/xylan/chitin deacetylase (PgdA/CDA1 family)